MKFTERGKVTIKIKKVSSIGAKYYYNDNNNNDDNNNPATLSLNNNNNNDRGFGYGSIKDFVEIEIRDTGDGIDPLIINTLFDKFTSKSANGLGIGLYLSKKIVEAHGGKIWARNNNNNNNHDRTGAIISFTLPIQERWQQRSLHANNNISLS
jgi:signal transduction histidine kinase